MGEKGGALSMKESKLSNIVVQLFAIFLAIAVLAPILYAISVSFMPASEILTKDYNLIPKNPTLENYKIAFNTTPLLRYMLNSFIVALTSSFFRVVFALFAAFSFAMYDFKGKKILFVLVLSTIMVPPNLLIVQNFVTVSKLHLVNTYIGVCSVFLISANNIFIIRQQFLTFTKSLQDAAKIDGASDLRFFFSILIPTNKAIIFTVFVSSFVNVWNQYVWPLIVTNRAEMRTIQVGITMLKDRESALFGPVMAGAVIALIPTLIVFIISLKKIVSGMMSGAVKA